MATQKLPISIDPIKFAEQGHKLHGTLPSFVLERLRDEVVDSQVFDIELWLQGGMDEQKFMFLSGKLSARLSLYCQRCLESFPHQVVQSFLLSPIRNEEEGLNLPARYEPLLFSGETVPLVTLIEDEVILNLPIAPIHAEGTCDMASEETIEKHRVGSPFLKLKVLK